jgi:regulator of cell morphogenesis and NO signaling
MFTKNIQQLLEENHQYASILHWCGIDAFDYLDATLEEVCRIKNLDSANVKEQLIAGYKQRSFNNLSPVSLCNHLQHTHHHYAQKMLPVIEHHIKSTAISSNEQYPQLLLLANMFTTFKKDFLTHIEYENNKVFPYIKKLEKYTVSFTNNVLLSLKDFSIDMFILKHHHDDDEMYNIRKLLKNYVYSETDTLPYKVLMTELRSFEQDLKEHSRIEEEILVPAAKKLEEALTRKVMMLVNLN